MALCPYCGRDSELIFDPIYGWGCRRCIREMRETDRKLLRKLLGSRR